VCSKGRADLPGDFVNEIGPLQTLLIPIFHRNSVIL
jgi:hypothetical protein